MTKLTFAVAGLTLVGASLLFAKVSTDYDKKTAFGKYKTYSWIQLKATNDLWKDRIAEAVDAQLTAKGWSKVESGGDASLAAYGSTKDHFETQTFYNDLGGFGWRYGWRGRWGGGFGPGGGGTATTSTQRIAVGSLMVNIFDSRDKNLIWQGEASDTLSDKPEKNEKKLENAVKDMFEKFPPEKG